MAVVWTSKVKVQIKKSSYVDSIVRSVALGKVQVQTKVLVLLLVASRFKGSGVLGCKCANTKKIGNK